MEAVDETTVLYKCSECESSCHLEINAEEEPRMCMRGFFLPKWVRTAELPMRHLVTQGLPVGDRDDKMVKEHLLKGFEITGAIAMKKPFYLYRLSSIIHRLRKSGMDIQMRKGHTKTTQYGIYYLPRKKLVDGN